jgi:hypothetical protein
MSGRRGARRLGLHQSPIVNEKKSETPSPMSEIRCWRMYVFGRETWRLCDNTTHSWLRRKSERFTSLPSVYDFLCMVTSITRNYLGFGSATKCKTFSTSKYCGLYRIITLRNCWLTLLWGQRRCHQMLSLFILKFAKECSLSFQQKMVDKLVYAISLVI